MSTPPLRGDFPIPTRIELPGVRAKVRLEEHDTLDGAFLISVRKNTAKCLVDSRLPVEVQRYIILHEIVHAAHDWLDQCLEHFPQHVMTKSMYKAAHPEWVEPGEETLCQDSS